jgi:preprotein translocase subunit SecA
MFKNLLTNLAGNPYERDLVRFQEIVEAVNALESQFQALSDAELAATTETLRGRLAEGDTLDDILPEAFAAVREAARRTIGLRPYDVQIIGGLVLHEGRIAEMKTGEGKTLVATLPLYLNALMGEGAHLVTVNDYLARRDGGWMGKAYHLLGITTSVIGKEQYSAIFDPDYVEPGGDLEDERLVHWRPAARQEAYQAVITYGTASEFGFDYLRDNIATDISRTVQGSHIYAVVDEVDSVLIDSARTPLIISGPAAAPASEYTLFAKIVRGMKRNTADLEMEEANGDYDIDDRTRSISLTEQGIARVEGQLTHLINIEGGESVYDPQYYHLVHYLESALKAQYIFKRDKDYIVQEGRVILIDQTTGRPMPSRRYTEGLHQAIEAKEGVDVRREDATVATITIQNYFRMYDTLAGMTGTALTEAEEFDEVYELDVVGIPTNVEYMAIQGELVAQTHKEEGVEVVTYERDAEPGAPAFFKRVDYADVIYKNEDVKFDAAIRELEWMREQGRPTLVGTGSVEASERLGKKLNALKIGHNVLNAKNHQKEALIVAQAGQPGVVTISTSMAGRGTDIILGGNPEGLAAQHVERALFTEAHLFQLAERYTGPDGGRDGALRLADNETLLDASLVDWLVETDEHYQAIVDTIEAKKLWHAVAEDLQASWDVPFEHMVDLTRYLSDGDAELARELVLSGSVPPEALVDARRRLEDYTQARAAYVDPAKKGEFLADRLFERHYNARASLIRAVLSGDLDEAQSLIETIPALPPSLIDEIQAIQEECRANREAIWQAGGLHILGTERHESRRIDNQLRGRAARQGDPGSSRFYLGLDDDLMSRFGGDRVKGFMEWSGVPDDEPITANLLSKAIEQAQSRFESFNFEIRKNLIEYDEAVNLQRGLVYQERREILEGQGIDLDAHVRRLFIEEFEFLIDRYLGEDYMAWAEGEIQSTTIDFSNLETGEVNAMGVLQRVRPLLPDMKPSDVAELTQMDEEELGEALVEWVYTGYEEGHNLRMLVGAIVRIMPLWPALPDVARGAGQEQQAQLETVMREAFDVYAASLPPAEQETHWAAINDGITRAYRELTADRAAKSDGSQAQAYAFNQTINNVLLDASHALFDALEPEALLEGLSAQVERLITLWRDHPAVGIGQDDMLDFERALLLSGIDTEWRQYLVAVDDLRTGIGLEAYGQRDPKIEFKRRVFAMFDELRNNVRESVVNRFFRELPRHKRIVEAKRRDDALRDNLSQTGYRAQRQRSGGVTIRKEMWDVGRNDPCPCGSGKKFKNCHYRQVQDQLQTVSVDEVKQTSSRRRRRR